MLLILGILVLSLQGQLWFSSDGYTKTRGLRMAVAEQRTRNQQLRERNILVRHFDRPRISGYLRVTIGTDDFRFVQNFRGMEVIEKNGTLIGWDGKTEVRTPYDNCVLIMPSRRLRKGESAVRFGRYTA